MEWAGLLRWVEPAGLPFFGGPVDLWSTYSLNSSDNVHALNGRSGSDESGCPTASAIGVPSTFAAAGCSKRDQGVTAGASSNQKDALRCTTAPESGVRCVEWRVDAYRLSGTDR